MNAITGVALLVSTLLAAVLFGTTWLLARSVCGKTRLVWIQRLIPSLLFCAAVPCAFSEFKKTAHEEDSICIVCGKQAHFIRVSVFALEHGPLQGQDERAHWNFILGFESRRAGDYATIFAAEIGYHWHRWHPLLVWPTEDALVGTEVKRIRNEDWFCRWGPRSRASWFYALPELADRQLARALVSKLRDAPEKIQLDAIENFADLDRPRMRLDEQFEIWHRAWKFAFDDWP